MEVLSTRNNALRMPALQAVLEGMASDGGLFVPEKFPKADFAQIKKDAEKGYPEVAARILALYFDIDYDTLLDQTRQAYADFTVPETVPVKTLSPGLHVMELFHGPTLAFKDMGLQVLPRLMCMGLDKYDKKQDALILTATSGDTGKAALEGFRDVPRTSVYVFYPADGVAEMQRLQMVTQRGANVGVSAVRGNFDDAQTGVKKLFMDKSFAAEANRDGYFPTSANSINIGRLIPQIVYYFYTYAKLAKDGGLKDGEPVNFVVPTGNFGNILAAHYAREMGLPVKKLICASNRNNVLTDFFNKGDYDARRDFHKTMSPSMDILVSSHLERLLFELSGRNGAAVKEWMESLASNGRYEIPSEVRAKLDAGFHADFGTDDETSAAIRGTFEKFGYLMDPHTAVAAAVYDKYKAATGDTAPAVVVSTASPYKFTPDVWRSLTGESVEDAFETAEKIAERTGGAVPEKIRELKTLPELHTGVVDRDKLGEAVKAFMESKRK